MSRLPGCLLLFLAALSAAAPAAATMQTRPVEWILDGTTFAGVLVYDDVNAIARPGIVMVPNWMGVTDDAIATARKIAGDDHVVLVADVYGKDVRPADAAAAKTQVTQAFADGGVALRRRVAQAVLVLKAQAADAPLDPERIGAVGFCFGGTAVLELARTGAPLAGVASLHAGLQTRLPQATAIPAPVLVLNGAADSAVPRAQIAAFEAEMEAAKADWRFVNFGGARHCFAEIENAGNPPDSNCLYDARAAGRAFAMLDAFFAERFSAPGP